jgi:hypothetical protein
MDIEHNVTKPLDPAKAPTKPLTPPKLPLREEQEPMVEWMFRYYTIQNRE